ncbi:hypothetical protein CEXT_557531 [Caerostris extrusa]|uniref:Uncharacterized protein n=1 Tax=Caerostris extrusa TaxID=172846 RepID=A0AAV4RAZ6_CAEEX|nr:hypothetical protein CEXT_557531 [Caerostris extrusa]
MRKNRPTPFHPLKIPAICHSCTHKGNRHPSGRERLPLLETGAAIEFITTPWVQRHVREEGAPTEPIRVDPPAGSV